MKRIHMGFSHGLMKMNPFVGGALNHAVSFILKTINRVNRLFEHEKYDYTITVNRAFEQVIRSCSLPRSYANETWISEDIIEGYCGMFDAGYGYSVEVWQEEQLVGGLYGVTIGKGCFGESMFSTQTDVSKMAFIR